MAVISTSCTRCGRISLEPHMVDLRLNIFQPEDAVYGFMCPNCDATIVRKAGRRVVRLLVANGVKAQSYFDEETSLDLTLEQLYKKPQTEDCLSQAEDCLVEETHLDNTVDLANQNTGADIDNSSKPITYDEIIDFHYSLNTQSWLEELVNVQYGNPWE